ncbi:MAG: 6-bladed beta-propeller [Bacteroidota bacterium]
MKKVSIQCLLVISSSVLLVLFSAGCTKRPSSRSNLPRETVERLAAKHRFDELFRPVGVIELRTDSSHLVGRVDVMAFFNNGNFAIGDNASHQILLFDRFGNFISQVGKFGRGPGEYVRIASLATNDRNELLCLDNSLNMVSRFDSAGRYVNSCQVKYGFVLKTAEDRGFYVYNYLTPPESKRNVVFKYDSSGNLVKSFGSPWPKVIIDRVPIGGGGMARFDNEIFIIQASEFKVRKYSSEGRFIKEFGRDSPVYKPLQPPVSFSDREKLESFTAVSSIFALSPGVLAVFLTRTQPASQWIELFDREGNFLTGAIEVPQNLEVCRSAYKDILYFVEYPSLIQGSKGGFANPKIHGYQLIP